MIHFILCVDGWVTELLLGFREGFDKKVGGVGSVCSDGARGWGMVVQWDQALFAMYLTVACIKQKFRKLS